MSVVVRKRSAKPARRKYIGWDGESMDYKPLGSMVSRKIGYGIVQPGQSIPNGVPVIKVNNLISGLRSLSELATTTPENDAKYARTRLHGGELVISVVGTIGKTAIVPKSFAGCNLARAIALVDIEDELLSKWVKYYLDSPDGQMYIEQNLNTTVQPTLNIKSLMEMPIPLFEGNEMKQIVLLLSSLDKKIQVNKEINDNLCVQARALINQWIADNESDYELLPLDKIALINPDTYSPKEEWQYVNYLDTSSITDGCIADIQRIIPSSEKLPSRARRKIAPNDIVFSTVRPNQRHFGIILDPQPNMLASTGFAVIRSVNPQVSNELIYLCLTENAFIEKMQQLAEQSTSTFPSIKPSDLGVCEIPCPKHAESNNLVKALKAMFALIATNHRENAALSELRDSLLPKLMSGKIDVSDIQP